MSLLTFTFFKRTASGAFHRTFRTPASKAP
jgi:hypothetical protein